MVPLSENYKRPSAHNAYRKQIPFLFNNYFLMVLNGFKGGKRQKIDKGSFFPPGYGPPAHKKRPKRFFCSKLTKSNFLI